MKNIFVTGISFKTAPLGILEKAYVHESDRPAFINELKKRAGLDEVALLATCNRVEIYGASPGAGVSGEKAGKLLFERMGKRSERYGNALYTYMGEEAVSHLYCVATSLDSMIVGEPQVLGQVKAAYLESKTMGFSGPLFSRVFPSAFRLAKRVRRETGLYRNPVSIPSVAIRSMVYHLGSIKGKSVLLVGAGEMVEKVAGQLISHDVGKLSIYNRSRVKAERLGEKFSAFIFDDLNAGLVESDIVVCSTSSKKHLISGRQMDRAMKRRNFRDMYVLDIAVPRDVDPASGEVRGVHLHNIDDLKVMAEKNRREREKEAKEAKRLVEAAVDRISKEFRDKEVAPLITGMKEKVEGLLIEEVKKTLKKFGVTDIDEERLEAASRSMAKKILHDPVRVIKGSERVSQGEFVKAASKLFCLED